MFTVGVKQQYNNNNPSVIKMWSRHNYFLRRPKAGRLRPSSKSGPEYRIPTLYYRGLVGGPAARWGGVPKDAPEPSPYMVLRVVWLVALRLDGVVFQKVAPEPPPCILLFNIHTTTWVVQKVLLFDVIFW